MAETQIRFEDGAAYEKMMGRWSALAGEIFLAWLAPPKGLRWLDVGCGNGAFTQLIVDRCAPAAVHGIDPSDGQLAFARSRPAARVAEFRHGDAEALPFGDGAFDAAAMALVIFFVPNPANGVAEMTRVVRRGGTVAAYAWDILGGGFPLDPIQAELQALGVPPALPPSVAASRMDALRDLWAGAGLEEIETRAIAVRRTFADFDDLWITSVSGTNIARHLRALAPADAARLKDRVRARLPAAADGSVTYGARANAIKGRVPA